MGGCGIWGRVDAGLETRVIEKSAPETTYSVTCSPPGPRTQLVVAANPFVAKLQLNEVSEPLAMHSGVPRDRS